MSDISLGAILDSTTVADRLLAALPTDVDYASARLVDERSEHLTVRRNQLEPIFNEYDTGVMISIWNDGGLGYCGHHRPQRRRSRRRRSTGPATGPAITAGAMVTTTAAADQPRRGTYALPGRGHVGHAAARRSARTAAAAVTAARHRRPHRRLVGASLVRRDVDTLLRHRLDATATRARIEQRFRFVYPGLHATANEGVNTQTRTFGGHAFCGQGGAEVLGRYGFGDAASRIAERGPRAAERAELPDRRRWTCCSPPIR